ncbi:MAG: hypothetical protein HYT12_03970 [Candidatus Liptonbacteria bacterium]|nr:hypothetical protein [Candidatus Liptonbacteria bacterium]
MGLLLAKWLLIFTLGVVASLSFSGPMYYQKSLIDQGNLTVFGYKFESIWTFLMVFYIKFWPLWFVMTFVMFWLFGRAVWFGNRIWVIHLTVFIAGQFAAGIGIHYFNKGELPDLWTIAGIIIFTFCIIMSAVSHG